MMQGQSSEPSMNKRRNCWNNAVVKSFSSSLKKERIKRGIYADRKTAMLDIAEYIDHFYNPVQRHNYGGGVSPNELEGVHHKQKSGAY